MEALFSCGRLVEEMLPSKRKVKDESLLIFIEIGERDAKV